MPTSDVELGVAGRCLIADHRVGDVGADVEGRGAGGPVPGALVAADRAPGEGGASQAELGCALPGEVEGRVTPPERVARGIRDGVREHRQDESLGVPERVTVVAGAGETLGRDRPPLCPGAGLERVEEREADGQLEVVVSLELHVGARPELVEVGALLLEQAVPAGVARLDRARRRPDREPRAPSARSTSRSRGT